MAENAKGCARHILFLRPSRSWLGALVLGAVLVLPSGCGRKGAEAPEPKPTETTDVPLPEWAPENPSREFLRAAKVLTPFPLEMLRRGAASELEAQANIASSTKLKTAQYELFGSLTDEQIERFLNTGEVRLPIKSLTKKQRAAFDNLVKTRRELSYGDLLVVLYKHGAAEDLSNVEFGFNDGAMGPAFMVRLDWWVRQPDGTVDEFNTGMFAYLETSSKGR